MSTAEPIEPRPSSAPDRPAAQGRAEQRRFLLLVLILLGAGGAALAIQAITGGFAPTAQLLLYGFLVFLVSLFGGSIPQWMHLTHNRMQHLISLVGGLMLGMAFFHLLPHALHATEHGQTTVDWLMLMMVAGVFVTFLMLRLFQHHHHGDAVGEPPGHAHGHVHGHAHGHAHEHVHSLHGPAGDPVHGQPPAGAVSPPAPAGHPGEPSADHAAVHSTGLHAAHPDLPAPQLHDLHARGGHPVHGVTVADSTRWIGVLLGFGLHTIMDGVALAASVRMDAWAGGGAAILGFGTFLAVFLHKPLDAISITSLMATSGCRPSTRRLTNVLFALICPLAAFLFFWGLADPRAGEGTIAALLAFSAGVFLCIALGDMLPEMEFHSHDRLTLTAMLVLGLLIAWLLIFLEGDVHAH